MADVTHLRGIIDNIGGGREFRSAIQVLENTTALGTMVGQRCPGHVGREVEPVSGPWRIQCGEKTRRGKQCMRQAMHVVDEKRPMCQQHWEMYVMEKNQ